MGFEQLCDTDLLLPGGLVLEGDRIATRAELRPLTGREEEWMAEHAAAPNAVTVTHLLSSCLIRLDDFTVSEDLVRQLLVGDRDYLMLQLRRLTLGDDFQAVIACMKCGGKMDVNFEAD